MLRNLSFPLSTHQSFTFPEQNTLLSFLPYTKPYIIASKLMLKASPKDLISDMEKGMNRCSDTNYVNKDSINGFKGDQNPMPMLLGSTMLFPGGSKPWVVSVEKPSASVSTKAQLVDHYVNILSQVVGNDKDAQMCLYHASFLSDYGFCCMLDEECARELAELSCVVSVQQDEHFESRIKDRGGERLLSDASHSEGIKTSKTKLFITGLSFYTSEKTLRAAFEPFGELVEVKVIMDKISKRSKGYAFVEYSSEDNATIALQEMNGKIINGWMIAVDRAKIKPRISKGRPRTMVAS